MKSYRVHAAESGALQTVPYLLLECSGPGRFTFDFAPLEMGLDDRLPALTLSSEALYELLEGKVLALRRDEGEIILSPEGDHLVVLSRPWDSAVVREYRVWLTEVGLAWNMLMGPGLHLA